MKSPTSTSGAAGAVVIRPSATPFLESSTRRAVTPPVTGSSVALSVGRIWLCTRSAAVRSQLSLQPVGAGNRQMLTF